jgi:hypothetical protein
MTEITMDTLITEDDRTAYQRGTLAARDDARREEPSEYRYSGRTRAAVMWLRGFDGKPIGGDRTIIDRFDWTTLFERLSGSDGCNFHEGPDGHSRWVCFGDQARPPLPFTRRILILMGVSEDDLETITDYCFANGGYCDCEMIMNTRDHHEALRRRPAWSKRDQAARSATSSA